MLLVYCVLFATSMSSIQESECCAEGITSSSFSKGFWGRSVKGLITSIATL